VGVYQKPGSHAEKAEALRVRRLGDTHNDLRFAASLLSGVKLFLPDLN